MGVWMGCVWIGNGRKVDVCVVMDWIWCGLG